MRIYDAIYGEFEVEEVLAGLIMSTPVQRLKGIHQGGASYLVNPTWNVTRFEHSVGVMLFIRKLGGTMEEQIAGLLHDVSHTAFSHVIDFVVNNKEEDFHETIYERVIYQSEIPVILKKHGVDIREIMNIDNWVILEKSLPSLCADRIDYTLRDMYRYKGITKEEINRFLQSLQMVEGHICIDSIEIAEWFTELYYKEVIDFFLHPLNIYGYAMLTRILKEAMEEEIISLDDFLLDDSAVLAKLQTSKNKKIMNLLAKLHPNVHVKEDKDNYDFHLTQKARIIDPMVCLNGQDMRKASDISQKVRELNQQARKKAQLGTFVKIM
jgi:uncharacterized protein